MRITLPAHDNMNLTNNDKKVLKLLLVNARLNDTEIALEVGITSQAVGMIRKKLEASIIDSYSLNINYLKLGITTFALSLAKLTKEGLNHGALEVEQELLATPQVINVYRLPKHSTTHLILYGFRNIGALDNFFHSKNTNERLHKYIESQELHTFSNISLLKMSSQQLFSKAIDDLKIYGSKMGFGKDD
jgi:DNA-binding Lrp family transcriptional regulator